MNFSHPLSTLARALLTASPLWFAALAHAQDAVQPGEASPAPALTPASAPASLDKVSVYGRGAVRQVETISQNDIAQLPPGSSPLAAVARLPSVNFQSADPFGAYEWSTRITVRGFSQNQLGFTLDDVPLGDMSYGNFNGLHISRAISSENIQRTLLSQGAGALDTASSSNLGGTLQFYSVNPSDTPGAYITQTVGSDSDLRTFVRLETGKTAYGKLYISGAYQAQDKWKGNGQDRSNALNLKYVNDFGENHFSAFANVSRRREIDYQDMSLEMIGRLGYNFDNTYPNYKDAIARANTLCGNGGSTYVSQCDDAYYAGSGLRNDELTGATLDAKVADDLRWKTTLYYHHNKGDGLWYTPYTPSPNGTPVSIRTTEYGIRRGGVESALSWHVGINDLKGGVWYEDNHFDQARRFYSLDSTGFASPYDFPSNPFYTQWAMKFKTTTTQFFIEDTAQLTDRLAISGGFKSLDSKISDSVTQANTNGAYVPPVGSIEAKKNFLPQIGITYALDNDSELFANAARNMRAFQGAATGASPFATTQAGFDAIKNRLRPETSDTYEGGLRSHGRVAEVGYEGVAAVYTVDFKDRLLATVTGAGIVGNPAVLSNVGRTQTSGVELALTLSFARGWSWYNGASFSSSKYKDDVVSGGVTVATNGKNVVDVPDTMVKSILGYDDGSVFGSFGVDYMAKRYYSYTNDASVPSRTLGNLSVGYRAANQKFGVFTEPSVQLNVANLFDKRYISTLGSNGFVNSDPTGTAQTLLPGSPRQFFVTVSTKL